MTSGTWPAAPLNPGDTLRHRAGRADTGIGWVLRSLVPILEEMPPIDGGYEEGTT